MLRRSIRVLAGFLLFAGAAGIIAAAVLFWIAVNSNTLPPPVDETTSEPVANDQTSYNPNEWQNCVSCHWEIVGGKPPGVMAASGDQSVEPVDGSASQSENATADITRTPALSAIVRATPTPLPQHKGALPQKLIIPNIGVEGNVVLAKAPALESGGTDWEVPLENIAWYVGTALPGSLGNTVMAGHVITRQGGGVFRNLHLIHKGDPINIETNEGTVTYVATAIRSVLPSDISVLADTNEPTLILITCTGEFDEATRTYDQRLVVTAKLAEQQ